MRRTNNHYSFEYKDHEERRLLAPSRNKDKNIKGVEFEVNDFDQNKTNELIDKLIDKRKICSKDTQMEYKEQKHLVNTTLSYDNTVHHEIVLQANKQRTIMKQIKEINELLNPLTIKNQNGTSMHIHLNKQYLRNEYIHDIDMVKAGECISHILYNLSGRETSEELERWVKTRVPSPLDMPIKIRSKEIERIELDDSDYSHNPGHYMMVNVSNATTTELRIFSNKHNFDYNHSKICLELTDVVVDIAKEMRGLSYINNYEIPINIVEDFFNSNQRRRKYYDLIKDGLAQTDEELKEVQFKKLYKHNYQRYSDRLNNEGVGGILRELRNINYNEIIDIANINENLDNIVTYATNQMIR